MGNLHFNKAVAADTNGAWALVEQHMIGANPPLHQHDREDEAWYVLPGRVRVQVGDNRLYAANLGARVLIRVGE